MNKKLAIEQEGYNKVFKVQSVNRMYLVECSQKMSENGSKEVKSGMLVDKKELKEFLTDVMDSLE